MSVADDSVIHFSITGIAPTKKTVKIPPSSKLVWILHSFKAKGKFKMVSTGELLDASTTPEALGLKCGKPNRTALEFIPESPAGTPRSRGSSPGGTAGSSGVAAAVSTSSATPGASTTPTAGAAPAGAAAKSGRATSPSGNTPSSSSPSSSAKPAPLKVTESMDATAAGGAAGSKSPTPAGAAAPTSGRVGSTSPTSGARAGSTSGGGVQVGSMTTTPSISMPLTPIASADFVRTSSNKFTVVDGVATLQKPSTPGREPHSARPNTGTAREEHVEVPQGESLQRASSTLRSGSNTPKAGGSSPAKHSGSRAQTPTATTPKSSHTAAATGGGSSSSTSAATPSKKPQQQTTASSSAPGAVHMPPLVPAAPSSSGEGTSSSKSRGVSMDASTSPQQRRNNSSNDPVVVAYLQLPDGRREPVYYTDGAPKPVFLVNVGTPSSEGSAAANKAGAAGAGQDSTTYMISTPRAAAELTPRPSQQQHQQHSAKREGSSNRFTGSTPVSNKDIGQLMADTRAATDPALPAPHQYHQNGNDGGSFFDQQLHHAAEGALDPMNSTEVTEQVNELRTILFNEQQRREELENRLQHVFGVADSWASLRHSLGTVSAARRGASGSPARDASLSGGGGGFGSASSSTFRRVDTQEAAILAEHERQLEELRRQRLVYQSAAGRVGGSTATGSTLASASRTP